mgnify:CR=1 FL=1
MGTITKTILKDREQWLENRTKGIGGSDIASVIGLNPWRSNIELWEIKTGRRVQEDISEKPVVKYGTLAEEYLRELFKLDFPEYHFFYEENNSWHNTDYPWAQASLDGWLTDKEGRFGVWECKTTEIVNAMQRDKWKDSIPDSYFCQVLMYMAVTNAEFAILKAQLKTRIDNNVSLQTKHYFIERSEVEADIEYLMGKGAEFWECVVNDTRPAMILPNI